MDFFNTVFNHACPSIITFVSKGLKEGKRYPVDSFNTVFLIMVVHKGLMDSKGCQMDSF